MSEDARERWWLVAGLPPSMKGRKADLEILREVRGDELRRTRGANALLSRLANATPYAQLVELFQEIEQTVVRSAKSSPVRAAADMNRAARALGKVAQGLPDDLRRHALEDFGVESEEVRRLELAIAEECKRSPFRMLLAVGNLERGPFNAAPDGIGNDAESIAVLAGEVPDVAPRIDLVATLRSAVIVAQRLIGRQLEIYRERVEEASLFLRRLASEAPDGAVGLMRSDQLDLSTGKINPGQVTFDPLALDRAVYLHRAIRRTGLLLAATEYGDATDPIGNAADTSTAVSAQDKLGSDGGSERSVDTEKPTRHHTSEQPTARDSTEPPTGDWNDQVLDLRALAAHATDLTDSLERVWSAALESQALAAAHDEINARFASLLRSVQRCVASRDRELQEAGIDPRLAALPLGVEEIGRLSFDPDPERCWRQLQLAELWALILLLDSLQAMRAPSAQRITLATGEVETWWEAGAFEIVRAQVRLLVRLSEQTAVAAAALLDKEDVGKGVPAFLDRLRLADKALAHGDVEGVLMHTRLALRQRAALEYEQLPADLIKRLAADRRLADEAPLLRLLEEATARLALGEALDLGAAVLAAPRALALAKRLCLQTPEIVHAALGLGEPNADCGAGEACDASEDGDDDFDGAVEKGLSDGS